jgi:hypothetical protein
MPQVTDITVREQTRLLTTELGRMAVKLDRQWWEGLAAGPTEAMALGEASQGVHRALLVLRSLQAPTAPVEFVTE